MYVRIVDGKSIFLPPEAFETPEKVVCTLGDSQIVVRQSDDGTCLVVSIRGNVMLEPRSTEVRLVVKEGE